MPRAPVGSTVPEDRSLEEFADAAADDDADTGDDVDADADATNSDAAGDADGGDGSPETSSVDAVDAADPAAPTYDYSPDGAACDACGESVTRRWRDDGDYVCADCKEW